MTSAADDAPLFDAVLTPHRSLSALGFWLLMGGVTLISFIAGLLFVLAWLFSPSEGLVARSLRRRRAGGGPVPWGDGALGAE